jgi:hypothetical protein
MPTEEDIFLSEIRNTIWKYKLQLKQRNIPIEIYTKVCDDLNLKVFRDPGDNGNNSSAEDEVRYRNYSYIINRGVDVAPVPVQSGEIRV